MNKRSRIARLQARMTDSRLDGGAPNAADSGDGAAPKVAAPRTAGQMLRAIREAAGVDAALVASALKVTPQKIEALEAERFNELPDMTFARGLAAAFCRAFGADPAPVLALMPPAANGLHAMGNTNSQPMTGGRGSAAAPRIPPLLWVVALLLLGAAAFWLWPVQPWEAQPTAAGGQDNASLLPAAVVPANGGGAMQPAPALPVPDALPAAAASAAAAASSTPDAAASSSGAAAAAPAASGASAAVPAASEASAAAASGGVLDIEATAETWLEVRDAAGTSIVNRTLNKGERISANGPLPLSVTIGRKEAVRVAVHGKPYSLAGVSGSVARFQVK